MRKYSSRPVENWKLEAVLEAGRLAPTGCDSQCQRIYVIRTEDSLRKIRGCCRMAFDAPVVLLIFADLSESWTHPATGRNVGETDTAIVTDHMMLRAADLGLGTCWVGYFEPEPIREAFGIPDSLTLMHILPLGYPADSSVPSGMHFKRKPLEDLVKYL